MDFSFDLDTEHGEESDRKLLLSFLVQLERGLRTVALEGYWMGERLTFIGETPYHLERAWGEVEGEFEAARNAVQYKEIEVFQSAGLTGRSLRAKLYLLMEWASRAADTAPFTWKRAVRRVLQNINSILGSFVYAAGVGEPIKEFKEMLENGLDDLEDGAPA